MSKKTEIYVKSLKSTILDQSGDVDLSLYEADGLYSPVKMYESMSDEQKKTLLWIIRQTQIDTISEVFGVIDGSSTLIGCDFETDMLIDGENTERLLQDLFLEHIQETEAGY